MPFTPVVHEFASGTGSESITGLTFAPRALIVLGTAEVSSSAAIGGMGYAVNGSPIKQGSHAHIISSSSGNAGTPDSQVAAFLRAAGASTTPSTDFRVTSFNSDGITVNKVTTPANADSRTFHILFYP